MNLANLTPSAIWTYASRTLTSGGGGGANGAFSVVNGVSTVVAGAGVGVFGSYNQLFAALAHSAIGISIQAGNITTATRFVVAIATGGAGSETDVMTWQFFCPFTTVPNNGYMYLDLSVLPKGARVSARVSSQTASDNIQLAVNLGLFND
jgi:hypothetical protein